MTSNFKDAYKATFESFPGIEGARLADEYVSQVEDGIKVASEHLDDMAAKWMNQEVDFLKGRLAEVWHAETYKIDGIRQGKDGAWSKVPDNHGPTDILYGSTPGETYRAQVKYYKTPEKTAKAVSRPDYGNMDQKVIPADQLEAREVAHREALRNKPIRPEQAEYYHHTEKTASDSLERGCIESHPLSEKEAKQMAKEYKRGDFDSDKHGLTPDSFVQIQDIIRESMEAAAHAAVITASLKAAPNAYIVLDRLVRTGEVDADEVRRVGIAAFQGAADGALRASIAAGLTGSCRSGLLGASLTSAPPSAIAAGTVIAINSSKYALAMSKGQITPDEFAAMCVRDTVIISCGVLGASVAQAIIPIPVLGALAGNFVGSMVGTAAHAGSRKVYYGLAVEKGWTFWGLVKQDYEVPRWILDRAGYKELFEVDKFKVDTFQLDQFQPDSPQVDSFSILPLRRGVIKCNVVGYLSA